MNLVDAQEMRSRRPHWREWHRPSFRKVVAPKRLAVAQPARPDLDRLDVLLVEAVVSDELRAAVQAVHFERALRPGLFVAAESEGKLLATFSRSMRVRTSDRAVTLVPKLGASGKRKTTGSR